MGLSNELIIGEWCCVEEGIAILERIHDFSDNGKTSRYTITIQVKG